MQPSGGSPTSHADELRSRQIRILHVEDSDIDADLTRAFLEKGGIRALIDRTQTREEFISCLDQNAYDLILSDYHLPSFDGIAALQIAVERQPQTPFIFLSGALGEEVAIEMLKKGATDYVLKQRMTRLAPAVTRALAEASERTARLAAEAAREELYVRERAAREEAEAASRIKDEFLAVASHELRTPLNAILGWATLLHNKTNLEEIEEGLAIIQRNAKHQAQLIEDILDVSRMIAGRLRINVRAQNLVPIIRRAVETVRPAADAKGVTLLLTLDEVGIVSCDSDRMEQVIWNLLSNAIKFTPRGGEVIVTLDRADSTARFTVKDTGRGIKADFLPYVFERFRQADGSTTRRHGGLGLGLAIVRNIIELHGGTVKAISDGDNCGACFTVEMPLLGSATTAPLSELPDHRSSPCPDSLSGLRALVIDDDRDARRLLEAMLELCGMHVSVAGSAAEGMRLFEEGDVPSVILSDIGMPDEDGNSFIRRIRAGFAGDSARALPAIALTAYTRGEDRKQALHAGFDAFLSKPVDPSELLSTLDRLVTKRK